MTTRDHILAKLFSGRWLWTVGGLIVFVTLCISMIIRDQFKVDPDKLLVTLQAIAGFYFLSRVLGGKEDETKNGRDGQ